MITLEEWNKTQEYFHGKNKVVLFDNTVFENVPLHEMAEHINTYGNEIKFIMYPMSKRLINSFINIPEMIKRNILTNITVEEKLSFTSFSFTKKDAGYNNYFYLYTISAHYMIDIIEKMIYNPSEISYILYDYLRYYYDHTNHFIYDGDELYKNKYKEE